MVLRRDRGLVQATRTRRKTPVQEAHDASRTNRHGTGHLTRSHDWKLGTWNCRSLRFDGSIRILSDILRVRKFSIVALQEVCWIGAEEVREYKRLGCRIYQSRGKKKRLGTAFIVLGEMLDRVIGWTPITDRMCVLRVKGRFFNISIINVHSPHSGSEDDEKDAFYEQLNWTTTAAQNMTSKSSSEILNAQVGQEEEFRPVIGKFSAHVRTNENGLRLIDFATSKNMAVRSTCFQHNLRDKYTWRSPQGTESQIDHVVIDGRHFSDIIDVRTYRGANVDSDHYLVMVKMRQRLSLAKSVRYRRPPRLDLERLKLPEVASRYAHSLEAALPGEAITNAAESTIGFVERGRRNDWFDEECRAILEEKNAARRAMLQYNLRDYEEAYGQKRRQQHQLFREKVRHHEELEFEDMEQLHRSNETRKFYKKLNGSRQGFTPRVEMCRDKDGVILTDEREVIDRWKQHFDEHLNGTEAEAGVQDGRREDYIGAAGEELIKMGPEKLVFCLHSLIVRIWESEQQPEEWKEGVICPIYKKGDKLDCENYRAITILNAAYKVFSQILFSRLSPIAEDFVGSYQAGFVVGRSTTDQIFTVRQILQKCREYQVPTHHLFIDFKAAYDSVDREELWKIMDENGFPGKLIRLTRMTMDGARCCVKISGAESDSFPSLGGLRQGDGISCLCFNVVLEGVMRRAGFNMRGTIFSKSNQFICYADDMDIVGRTLKAVADAYTGLKREAEKCSIYKSLIRPVVLYGHETWTMLEEDLRALSVFERRVLRTIFGGVFGNDGWRRRMNHELAQLYNEPSIRKVAKAGRLQWAGHVARMPERPEQLSQRNQRINPAKLVFVSEPGRFGSMLVQDLGLLQRETALLLDAVLDEGSSVLQPVNLGVIISVSLRFVRFSF
ncbi:LOW QUALITY PROTEIN: uncharacterized protein LOC120414040 [Culex pipiens pallens]|uniref:LOW QUALITY PROTEIN: uncharacterized protein LOC120414040 n=1 Tax=Culex pipiens pallens TaxID=42434 RepID=UPI0022AA761E|nr:LOW QUALITY PROTEIN: uncharacterized protein LOC120414040 [Culex pipiens pallens]